jgi:hypothetical protein
MGLMPQYALVPNEATSSSVKLWVGCRFGAPGANLAVHVRPGDRTVPFPKLEPWPLPSEGAAKLYTGRLVVSALNPQMNHTFRLLDGGTEVARCEVSTLPAQVGDRNDPLIVFVGSCFCRERDRGVGAAISGLPPAARPHIKILGGDQVYLDQESRSLGGNSEESLREVFLAAYWKTWTSPGKSLAQALVRGANWFISEDHEFWNNYPYRNAAGFDTWLPWGAGKKAYMKIANQLYERFQTESAFTTIDVPPVSFALLDTRRFRDDRKEKLCRQADFDKFEQWLKNLSGPGVLITGQPIFDEDSGLFGTVKDLALPDYEQYEDLLRALASTRQPLLLVTGDVHFGRIASTTRVNGPQLIEIVASPLAIVPGARGRWREAPAKLLRADRAGLNIETIQTRDEPRLADEHFATLELAAVQSRVDLTVQYWRVDGSAGPVQDARSQIFTLRS